MASEPSAAVVIQMPGDVVFSGAEVTVRTLDGCMKFVMTQRANRARVTNSCFQEDHVAKPDYAFAINHVVSRYMCAVDSTCN